MKTATGEEVYLLYCLFCLAHRWSQGGHWQYDKQDIADMNALAEKLDIPSMMAKCSRCA